MKKLFLFIFLCFYSFFGAQNLDWFYVTFTDKTDANNYKNYPTCLAVDTDEDVYIGGVYRDQIGFDENNPLNFQLSAQNTSSLVYNCYLAKIDKNKNYLWHKTITFTGDGAARITSITIDKEENIIVVGTVEGKNINLNPTDPSPILYNTVYPMTSAIFINKYSKNGDFIFGNFYIGGSGFPKVTTDSQNNIITTGSYYHYQGLNTDFDLSDQVYYLNGQFGFSGASFILKTTKNGDFKWAKYVQGHNQALIHSVKIDGNDNIIFFGNNEAYFDFNGEHTSPNITSANEDYIAKINKDGNFIWRQQLGGQLHYSAFNDSQPFDIDTDNSIVVANEKIKSPLPFPNKSLFIDNYSYRGLLIKMDENGNYLWHSTMAEIDYSQQHFPITVTINSDHSINLTTVGEGVYHIFDKDENKEEIKGWVHNYSYSSKAFSFLLKFNPTGKLIYNKYKMTSHYIGRVDRSSNKLYFAGRSPGPDRNPDQNIFDPPVLIEGDIRRGNTFIQKLDKCYSGTPDGDPFFYTCISEVKKIKDLHPKTSYSSWYDSPTSTTPLSPDTVLKTKKYYAMTQDASCPFNSTRLEVDVKVFQNPPKLVVPDFTFCNLQNKTLYDLKINNNQDVEFFDENLTSLYLGTYLVANKKYYVRQIKQYYPYISCRSELTEFYVYDISVAPLATNNQNFCKINKPHISDIIVVGINLKWYDSIGNILPNTTLLQDQTKYYVSQTSGTCESAKTEIAVTLNDPNPPTGNATQDFCSAQLPTISNIIIVGQNIKWFDATGSILPTTTQLLDGKTYYATQTLNGCESTQKLAVKVNITNGGIPANDYAIVFCNPTTDNTKTENLNNYKGNLIVNPANYLFEFFNSSNQLIADPSNLPLNLGSNSFNVKISNNLGCFVFVKLTLTLNPKPNLNLPAAVEFCNGQNTTLDAGTGFSKYEWTKSGDPKIISTKQILTVTEDGKYTIKVKNNFGCENSALVNVTQSILATITGVQIVNSTATVQMSAIGDFIYSINNLTWQNSNVFTNLNNGNYTVYVKTKLGCIIGSMNFSIFSISNIFTPNADGINDMWKISGLENYRGSEVKVFDRFGNMVFQKITTGPFEWDGTFNSRHLPTGSYWYVVKVSDGRLMNGWVVLKNRN